MRLSDGGTMYCPVLPWSRDIVLRRKSNSRAPPTHLKKQILLVTFLFSYALYARLYVNDILRRRYSLAYNI